MDRSRKYEVNATYNNVYEVKAAFVGYIGDIVALSVGGYVEAADGTNVVIGVLKESVDNTKGGNGDKEVLVDVNPKVWLPRAGASISDLFKRVYATGTNAVALGYNPTTKKADGIVIDYRTDEVLIDFLKGDTAPEAGSGDFLADGSVPMTGDFKLGGNDIWLNAAGTSKIANDGNLTSNLSLSESGVSSLTARNAKTSLVGVINEINAALDLTGELIANDISMAGTLLFSEEVSMAWGGSALNISGNVLFSSEIGFEGNITLTNNNLILDTTTGTKIGTATNQKLAFWNSTPVVQQVLATGGGATVDNVISLLQTLGLCRQA